MLCHTAQIRSLRPEFSGGGGGGVHLFAIKPQNIKSR